METKSKSADFICEEGLLATTVIAYGIVKENLYAERKISHREEMFIKMQLRKIILEYCEKFQVGETAMLFSFKKKIERIALYNRKMEYFVPSPEANFLFKENSVLLKSTPMDDFRSNGFRNDKSEDILYLEFLKIYSKNPNCENYVSISELLQNNTLFMGSDRKYLELFKNFVGEFNINNSPK